MRSLQRSRVPRRQFPCVELAVSVLASLSTLPTSLPMQKKCQPSFLRRTSIFASPALRKHHPKTAVFGYTSTRPTHKPFVPFAIAFGAAYNLFQFSELRSISRVETCVSTIDSYLRATI